MSLAIPALRRAIAAALAVVLLTLATGLALAAEASPAANAAAPFRARLEAIRGKLDAVETRLGQQGLDDTALAGLRGEIEARHADLTAVQNEVSPLRDASKARLDKIGPPPKPEDPPESADVTEARKTEQTLFGDLDGVVRESQVQMVRSDQIANTITERRRETFARQLTERSASVLDPYFWVAVASDVPRALFSLSLAGQNAWNHLQIRASTGSVALALSIVIGGIVVARFLRRRLAHLRGYIAHREGGASRFFASLDPLLGVVYALLGWPTGLLAATIAVSVADLLPDRWIEQFAYRVVLAVSVAVAYRSTADGMLALDRPALRLLPLSDWAVKRIHRRMRVNAVIIGIYLVLTAIGRAIYAPVSLTVALTAITAALIATVAASLLIRLRNAPLDPREEGGTTEENYNRLDILRPFLWLAVIGIFGCLATGYVAMASFFAFFPLVAIFIAAVSYLLMVLVDSALTEGLSADSGRSRALSGAIGVRAKNLAFAGTLLSGVLRFTILAIAALVLAGPLGFYSTDIVSAFQRAFFGFQIGEITISPSGILLGAVLFALVIGITRLIRAWVGSTLLPRTTLDAGLQNSIATIVGYCGVVLAIAVALSEIGINLQNFAIVAGALSVGIGFGLQSIVSNFVSGLILLAERPIRVGDIIAVGGEEGFVRRISVRATQVETYDRATLIVPNSQLISGTVKNWVYGNTWSRVRVTLSVGYDVDAEEVRRAIVAAAADDPRILPSPPPRVFLIKLGDAALEFELIAVVASIETMAAVKSDLQLRILKNFREKGIRLVAQLPAAPAPIVVSLQDAMASVETARDEAKN